MITIRSNVEDKWIIREGKFKYNKIGGLNARACERRFPPTLYYRTRLLLNILYTWMNPYKRNVSIILVATIHVADSIARGKMEEGYGGEERETRVNLAKDGKGEGGGRDLITRHRSRVPGMPPLPFSFLRRLRAHPPFPLSALSPATFRRFRLLQPTRNCKYQRR